jgi:hypothetical protein
MQPCLAHHLCTGHASMLLSSSAHGLCVLCHPRRDIEGAWQADGFTLLVDHVQGDPYASPSRFRVQVRVCVLNAAIPLLRVGLQGFCIQVVSLCCSAGCLVCSAGHDDFLQSSIAVPLAQFLPTWLAVASTVHSCVACCVSVGANFCALPGV